MHSSPVRPAVSAKQHNLTQQQVADYLNCSAAAYSRYENEIREPSIDVIIKLASLYEVSVDCLVSGTQYADNYLPDEEIEILGAFRKADLRARKDALELLRLHKRT